MPEKEADILTAGTRCATRYPILLVHGVASRDDENHRIWGRVPDALEKEGARIYYGEHDAWGTPLSNAAHLCERLVDILADSKATKVNIIAHSKGGIDARCLIAQFPPQELPVASLTTLSTPHHGSRSMQVLLEVLKPVLKPIAYLTNSSFKKRGDKNPDFIAACHDLTQKSMAAFNAQQPELPHILSQQFGSCISDQKIGMPYSLLYKFITSLEGPNDGLVSMESAAYDNFKGKLTTSSGKGVPHSLQVGVLHKPSLLKKGMGAINLSREKHLEKERERSLRAADIIDFYIDLVADLKAQGL